jgi:methylase of polypeptide subunit release factors
LEETRVLALQAITVLCRGEICRSLLKSESQMVLLGHTLSQLLQTSEQEAAAGDDDEASSSSSVIIPFLGLRLSIGGDQLRPRASSAAVVEAAVAALAAAGGADLCTARVLDLGTGCGALLLAALSALPAGASGCGVDLDAAALRYARANADGAFGAEASRRRVALLRADFGALHAPAARNG